MVCKVILKNTPEFLQVIKEAEDLKDELDSLYNKNGIHNANTCFNHTFTKVFITRCSQKNAITFQCEIL